MNNAFIKRTGSFVINYHVDYYLSGYPAISSSAKKLFKVKVEEELESMRKIFGFSMEIHVYEDTHVLLRLNIGQSFSSDETMRHCAFIEQAIDNHHDILTNLAYMEEHDTDELLHNNYHRSPLA
jgi:hypothetical protein